VFPASSVVCALPFWRTEAQVPSAATSAVPSHVLIVGTHGGTPDSAGQFSIIVRDAGNNPLAGVTVTLDFSRCSDVRLANTQTAGTTLSCAHNSVSRTTDAAGQASFNIVGASIGRCAGLSEDSGADCVRVCANNVVLASIEAAVLDLDGASATPGGDGLSVVDLSLLATEFNAGLYRARSDYDHNGAIGGGDLTILRNALRRAQAGAGSQSGSNGAGYCAGPFTATCDVGTP
jgi:hypothetical protein